MSKEVRLRSAVPPLLIYSLTHSLTRATICSVCVLYTTSSLIKESRAEQ
jgi:hypothetical protein